MALKAFYFIITSNRLLYETLSAPSIHALALKYFATSSDLKVVKIMIFQNITSYSQPRFAVENAIIDSCMIVWFQLELRKHRIDGRKKQAIFEIAALSSSLNGETKSVTMSKLAKVFHPWNFSFIVLALAIVSKLRKSRNLTIIGWINNNIFYQRLLLQLFTCRMFKSHNLTQQW